VRPCGCGITNRCSRRPGFGGGAPRRVGCIRPQLNSGVSQQQTSPIEHVKSILPGLAKPPRLPRLDIFTRDVTRLSSSERSELLQLYALQRYSAFGKRLEDNLRFERRYLVKSALARGVFTAFKAAPPFVPATVRRKYAAFRAHLKSEEERDSGMLNKILYLDNFQALEEYVGNVLKGLLWLFPKFLQPSSEAQGIGTVMLGDLYDHSDIRLARRVVIDRKIKAQVQSESMSDLLTKGLKKFGVTFELSEVQYRDLSIITVRRNVLVHSDGVVSDAFIGALAKRKIKHSFKMGQKLPPSIADVSTARALIVAIVGSCTEMLMSDAKQIAAYHDGKD
jgi:hypothetical protein